MAEEVEEDIAWFFTEKEEGAFGGGADVHSSFMNVDSELTVGSEGIDLREDEELLTGNMGSGDDGAVLGLEKGGAGDGGREAGTSELACPTQPVCTEDEWFAQQAERLKVANEKSKLQFAQM